MPPAPIRGKTVVVTGVTGQVAEPVALALAADNEVVGAARFRDADARRRLEAAGIRCVPIDLASGDVRGLPGGRRLRGQLRRRRRRTTGSSTCGPTAAGWPG